MKNRIRKYVLIALLFLTSLFCAVGASTWIILSEQTAKPSSFTAINTTIDATGVSASKIYYGEQSTITGLKVKAGDTDVTSFFNQVTPNTKTLTGTGTAENSVSGSVSVSFALKDEYKNVYNLPTAVSVSVPMYAVASYNNSTYYSTIDQALAAANSKNTGTVYALPLGELATTTAYELDTGRAKAAKTIGITNTTTTTTEINSGVTFRLPFTTVDDTKTTDNTETIDTEVIAIMYNVYQKNASAYGVNKYLQNQVFVKDNYTLTNYGTLTIAGQVSGGDATNTLSSMTAGNHAQLNLGKNTTLNNGLNTTAGTIRCYGYINDGSGNNTAKMNANKGNVTVVFSIIEHRGGAYYFGMLNPDEPTVNADGTTTYNFNETVKNDLISKAAGGATGGLIGDPNYTPTTLQCPPFNRFYIESINCKFTNYYTSAVLAFADLYADNQQNKTTIDLIGTTNKSLISLTSENSYIENQFDSSTKKHTLNIFGSISVNPLTLSLYVKKSVAEINIHLTTTNVFFPISNHFSITLNPVDSKTTATVDLTAQRIKLLPGSNLTINKGVTVNTNYLAIYAENTKLNGNYEDFDAPYSTNDLERPYTNNTPAKLIVNGTLNAANIGGNIQTTQSSGIINITKNTVMSKEMKSRDTTQNLEIISGVSLPYAPIYYYTDAECTLTAKGKALTSNNATLNNGTYYSNGSSWYTIGYKVTLNANNGKFSDNTALQETTVSAEKLNGANGGYVVTLPTVTRDHYTFSHWCDSSTCANGNSCEHKFVNGTAVYQNTTLYAHWNAITYTINYVVTNSTSAYQNLNATTLKDGATESITLYADKDHVIDSDELFFKGWYLDSTLSANKKITSLSLDDIASGKVTLSNNTLTVYGTFLSGYPVKFYINDTDVQTALGSAYTSGIYNESTVTPTDLISDEDLNALNVDTIENQDVTKYFVGWYLDSDCTQAFDINTFDPTSVTSELALYAKWADKSIVTLTSEDVDYPIATTTNFYYKPNYEFTINVAETAYDSNTDKEFYFDGWNHNGNTYQVGDTLTLTETSGITFTAVWASKVQVTVVNSTTINTTVFATKTYHVKPNDKFELKVTALESYTAEKTTIDQKYYFGGWNITEGADGTGATIGEQVALTISIDNVDSSYTYTVKWIEKFTLSFNTKENNSKVNIPLADVYLISGQEFDLTTANEYLADLDDFDNEVAYDRYFNGWVDIDTSTITIDTDTTITVNWGVKCNIKVTLSNATITIGQITLNNGDNYFKKAYITFSVVYSEEKSRTFTINTINNGEDLNTDDSSPFSYSLDLLEDIEVAASASGCFAAGTLITLADGTQKKIEDLSPTDYIMVFDHETGQITSINNTFIIKKEKSTYPLLKLYFEKGITLDILFEHGIFDYTTNQYEILSPTNVESYLGDYFYAYRNNQAEKVRLISYKIDTIETECYSLMSPIYINHFANNLLCVSDGINGLYNIFDLDENMMVDQIKKQADIEKYGLSEYEDWKEYFTYEQYIAFNVQYYHIIIGKGLCTDEDIIMYIEKYLSLFT